MLRKVFLTVFILVVLAFLTAQLFRPDFTNPAVAAGMEIDSNAAFTPEVRRIIKTSCADCHSNETVYPWYSRITPVNWWLKDHIDDGRAHMNFSTDPAGEEWDEICKEVTSGKMPMPSYTWGHPEAVLSESDKKTLCDWAAGFARSETSEGGEREGRERD